MRASAEAEYREYVTARSYGLWHTAFLLCGDAHQAEDVVQTALLKVYVAWNRVQRAENRDAYVRRVLVRCVIDEKRRGWRRERAVAELPELPAREDPDVGERDAALQALARLAPRQRATLVLRFWEDLSVEQTADLLGFARHRPFADRARAGHPARDPPRPAGDGLGPRGQGAVMTGFEDHDYRDGESGEAQGDQARALFARTVAGSSPHLAFTAHDLVLGGRRRVRRRRLAAVAGSTASVAVVAVAATAFAGGGGGPSGAEAVSPATSVTSHLTTPPTPTITPSSDDARTLAEEKLAAAVFAEMYGKLDPGLKHLTLLSPPSSLGRFAPNSGTCIAMTNIQTGYALNAEWTADGRNPSPRSDDATSPYVLVSIDVFAPGALNQFGGSAQWGPFTRTPLSDGSVVEAASADNGHRVQAVRTMANGQQILFRAAAGTGALGGKTELSNPFPFTSAQLSAIVSGMSLPLPFADGYQPHVKCGS